MYIPKTTTNQFKKFYFILVPKKIYIVLNLFTSKKKPYKDIGPHPFSILPPEAIYNKKKIIDQKKHISSADFGSLQ